MPDSRFFHNAGSLTLKSIAAFTGAQIVANTEEKRVFSDVAPLGEASADDVSFLDNVKYIDAFGKSAAGACFVRKKYALHAPKSMALLITEEPYSAYAITAQRFYPPKQGTGISPAAHISATATIGKNCTIAPGVWIDDGVIIGDDCHIGANSTISHSIIGNRVVIHRGVHIGQDGFGFAPGRGGILKVPQLGRVIIGSDVEIGSGTCIDRGAGPDTAIGDFSKIDNLVQIGHNVQIGKYVLIAAGCGISGSTVVDDGAMLGGQVGLAGHITIGKRAKIAAQAGVMNNVPDGATYGGSPAVPIVNWHRQSVTLAKLSNRMNDER